MFHDLQCCHPYALYERKRASIDMTCPDGTWLPAWKREIFSNDKQETAQQKLCLFFYVVLFLFQLQ